MKILVQKRWDWMDKEDKNSTTEPIFGGTEKKIESRDAFVKRSVGSWVLEDQMKALEPKYQPEPLE